MQTVVPSEPVIPVFTRWFGTWQIAVARRAYTSQQLSQFYDAQAPRWDRTLGRLGCHDAYRSLFAKLARHGELDLPPSANRVLDAGIGTGALCLALQETVDRPLVLDGVDLSARMLDQAANNLRARGYRAALTQASITALPYDDDTFDLVMSAHVLEHVPDPQAALKELQRVLKPGGLLLACITRRSRLGAYVHLKWHTHQISAHEGRHWFRACGLRAIRVLPFNKGTLTRRTSIAYMGRKTPPPSPHDSLEPHTWT